MGRRRSKRIERRAERGAAGAHSGTFNATSGAEVDFGGNAGSNTFTSVTGTGAGTLRFQQGTNTFTNAATLTNLALDQATINGPGAITFTGTFNWKGGTLNAPTTNSGGTLISGPCMQQRFDIGR